MKKNTKRIVITLVIMAIMSTSMIFNIETAFASTGPNSSASFTDDPSGMTVTFPNSWETGSFIWNNQNADGSYSVARRTITLFGTSGYKMKFIRLFPAEMGRAPMFLITTSTGEIYYLNKNRQPVLVEGSESVSYSDAVTLKGQDKLTAQFILKNIAWK